ncbi:MAG: response regulator [Candidatus Omnitrophica bacterium]|nr:response regulator [Candidatus Omnitrophota bacterium]
MDTKRILVIDDEQDLLRSVKTALETGGIFEVSTAADGRQGIAAAKRIKPHLILLDILMPGMDGLKVLERLKEDRTTQYIPVIMLSAVESETIQIKAAQLYDEEYIVKPVKVSDLKAKIEEVLKRRGS